MPRAVIKMGLAFVAWTRALQWDTFLKIIGNICTALRCAHMVGHCQTTSFRT